MPLEAILEPIGEKRAGRRRAREDGEAGHQRDSPVFAGNVVDANAIALLTATTTTTEEFNREREIRSRV